MEEVRSMQSKKLLFILGTVIIVVAGAAFAAGRLLNRGVSPLGLFTGTGISLVTDIIPAEELPKQPPEVEGLFVERQDNIIFVEGSQPTTNEGGVEAGSGGGPRSEVVITGETLIYHDTTEPPSERPTGDNNPAIQQTVEEGTLDDLYVSQALVMVWGRKSGDRIIAEVMVYIDLEMRKTQ
jgi:hypothetical protein